MVFFDANGDGILDLYLAQARLQNGDYCSLSNDAAKSLWGGAPIPPSDWKPPVEPSGDILFLGNGDGTFVSHLLELGLQGCPGINNAVVPFGHRKIAVAYS